MPSHEGGRAFARSRWLNHEKLGRILQKAAHSNETLGPTAFQVTEAYHNVILYAEGGLRRGVQDSDEAFTGLPAIPECWRYPPSDDGWISLRQQPNMPLLSTRIIGQAQDISWRHRSWQQRLDSSSIPAERCLGWTKLARVVAPPKIKSHDQ